MRVLVTGAAGFTGTAMVAFLSRQAGVEPVALVRNPHSVSFPPRVPVIAADLLDRDALHAAVAGARPDAVIHLAGLTRGKAEALHAANVTGTRNLLDAVFVANPLCRVLVVSSSAVYGYAGDGPIPETAPLRPVDEYGKSKVAQEDLAREYAGRGFAVAIARPFNLAGPGQGEAFVCGRIVKQVIGIERTSRAALELREVSSSRDLIDVRDVVQGYGALLSRPDFTGECAGKVFNLGSGNAYRISSILAMIEAITGMHYDLRLPETPPVIAVPTQQSDNTRITSLTGWKPVITLEETLRDMIAAERGMTDATARE
jgi:nucleoside-diphosphate-sugar epimerase